MMRGAMGCAAALILAAGGGAVALAKPVPTPPAATAPPSSTLGRADAEQVMMLVRTTLVALHQANVTGNYTVLRDLAAPDFHDRNSAADLARIFASVRDRQVDLAEAVLLDPHLANLEITPDKKLHVAGWLATRPAPVSFEMLFQPSNGTWRLYGMAVNLAHQVGP